ncbi:MAG: zinc-binding dehydrogenase [Acidobacteria bacterium]|nr:zinc-binding dehydrogenase [Acidobacteriota bacterium]
MKAIRVNQTGGPEVLSYEEIPTPSPAAGQALVKIEASGVNFIDIYFRTGLYKHEPPFTNGQEGAGVVEAVGEGVTDLQPGDRVAYTGVPGSYAEYAVVPAARLVKLPDSVSSKMGAAVMLQGMTVHYLTHSTFPLMPGHTCLVHAAAGGIGLILVQVAKMRGAQVIGTCSTAEKAEKVKAAGADHVILYTEQDFVAETKAITHGRGVDVAYDSVGKTTWEGSMNCLRPRGMLVLFGNASGPVPPIDPLMLSQKGSIFVTRPTLVHHIADRQELEDRARDVLGWVGQGRIQVHIGQEYPLAEAAQAQIDLAGRKTTGKLLLIP